MNQQNRWSIGIDCAAQEHEVCLSRMTSEREVEKVDRLTIDNNYKGFKQLEKWLSKHQVAMDTPMVMEATGVYHELLADYFFDAGRKVWVVVPSLAHAFSKTLKIKSVNDRISCFMLSVLGLEKKLDDWKKPDPLYRKIRNLTRERSQLLEEKNVVDNQMHAEKSGAWTEPTSLRRMKARQAILKKQLAEITTELKQLLTAHEWLTEKVKKICTIKGIGELTAMTILAETDGFNLIRNKKQLVSYAGLDVVEKTSGTSVRSKTRISKKGNRYIRKALYFPAFTAVRGKGTHQDLYKRLVAKTSIKMKGAVAVQRKLLILVYTLWKNDTVFDPNYPKNELGQSRGTTLNELT